MVITNLPNYICTIIGLIDTGGGLIPIECTDDRRINMAEFQGSMKSTSFSLSKDRSIRNYANLFHYKTREHVLPYVIASRKVVT